ncbi:DUF2946 family protein [Betaproteobacteria bacterium PRO7]|jgi:hypothetical protein|nr:DUF2946 family protein [Betaproteobacteria bacterium PRO7]GIL06634.1 MAG: hypothetical protein BroJett031_31540 [Betaproteobacteria bacterium]
MDDSVLAAIAKWPNVPAVFGWLLLTARGEWRIKGEPIANEAIRDFIGRNYAADERGRWFFQNGPQRVYVALEATPWIYRIDADGAVRSHTGAQPRVLLAAGLLDDGRFVLQTDLGAGLVDDRDGAAFVRAVTDARGVPLDDHAIERWLSGDVSAFASPGLLRLAGPLRPFERLRAAALEQRFGFVRAPAG